MLIFYDNKLHRFKSCKYNKDISVTIVDLNKQLIAAKENIKTHGFIDRVSFVEQNMLFVLYIGYRQENQFR